jgi:rSAM/selenodomain-associated transferase 1
MRQLAIFAKYWEPGRAKTRLARDLGSAAACRLSRAFLVTALQRLAQVADRRTLVFAPADRRTEFAALAASEWSLVEQAEGDLGARLKQFFTSALRTENDRFVLIGADSPTLPLAYVEQAFRLLESYPVVLGPAADGGYYLVGARHRPPPIFDRIDWSTSAVWRQTLDRLREAECPYAELPPWYDVDELADFERLRAELAAHRSDSADEFALLRLEVAAAALPSR